MSIKAARAVILGAPASGKGTISKRIVEKFGFAHISPGDILRLNVLKNTKLGQEVKTYMDAGQLVPDDVVIKSVLGRITDCVGKPWLLDGFPRTLVQAERLHAFEPVDTVLNLQVPHDVIVERVKGRWIHLPSGRVYNVGFNDPKEPGKDDITGEPLAQREDDNPVIVKKRLESYDAMIKPVLEFYEQHGLVKSFSGSTTAEIWPQVERFLQEKARVWSKC